MKPEYANTFGIRKVVGSNGELIEITLDIAYKYMDTAVTATQQGLENVSTPTADTIASVVMNGQSALSLRNLLNQTLTEDAPTS